MLPARRWTVPASVLLALASSAATAGSGGSPAGDEDPQKVAAQVGPDGGGGARESFESRNMELLAWIPLSGFSGGSTSGANVWGYVSPSGREYVIMCIERGFGFVEVTDPRNPVIVAQITGPTSLWHDVKVIGEYAYGVSEGGSGIQVMDMTNIDAGAVTLVKNKTQQGHSSTHTILSNPDSGFLYLAGTNVSNGGLTAVSTSMASDPTFAGAWTNMYVHEAQIVTYTEGPYAGREIAFCFSGFNGGWSQTGLRIVDVTNKANMFTISTISWSGARYAHQGWLTEDKKHIYIDDELDEGDSVNVTTTRIFDVEDLANPIFKGTFTTGLPSTDHNLYVKGNLLFESNYRSGLRVFDIVDPLAPVEIAWFDTFPGSDAVGFDGSWGNFPFFPSGTIAISDLSRGLFIVRLQGVDLSFLDAPTLLQPGTPTPVTVQITESFGTYDPQTVDLNISVNGGAYAPVEMTDLGSDQFTADLPGSDCFDTVDYYVSAETDSGVAQTETINAFVGGDLVVSVDHDFETASGWTVGDTGDNATTGIWNRQDPVATDAQPGDDVSTDGAQCWVTDGRGGGVGDWDVDNGKTTLKSPVIDLTALNDPWLGVWVWYSNNMGGDPNNDTFRIDVSSNGGSTWVNARTLGPAGEFAGGGWYRHELRVADAVTPTATFRARFVAEDAGSGSIVEAAVDEFQVFDYECNDCVADFNGDGSVNTQDVLAFLNAWAAGDSSADINGDGSVNTQDVLAFLNLWTAGC